MDDMRLGGRPFFDRGVEEIVEAPAFERPSLPQDLRQLAPATLGRVGALETLLEADNLEALLEAAVLPVPTDRQVLSPTQFRAALDEAGQCFERAAAALAPVFGGHGGVIEAAHRVIAHEIDLREQLQAYRRALLQG